MSWDFGYDGYQQRKAWSDKWGKAMMDLWIQQCMGVVAAKVLRLRRATKDEDIAGDDWFIELEGNLSVQMRVRREHIPITGITWRAWYDNGKVSEFERLLKLGRPQYMLYGWAVGEEPPDLRGWVAVDMRTAKTAGLLDGLWVQRNRDGYSGWVEIPLSKLRAGNAILKAGGKCVRAQQIQLPGMWPEQDQG